MIGNENKTTDLIKAKFTHTLRAKQKQLKLYVYEHLIIQKVGKGGDRTNNS